MTLSLERPFAFTVGQAASGSRARLGTLVRQFTVFELVSEAALHAMHCGF